MHIDLKGIKELIGRLNQHDREKFIRNLRRITFNFKINKSFLNYPQHPLTIPKEFYPFLDMHGIIKKQEATVAFPDNSTAEGYIQYSNAGWGEYHQIKIRSPYSGAGISGLKIGDVMKVEIYKVAENTHIELSKPD
jgi:hypothetical protein